MALFNKKKQEVPQEPKQESKTDTVGKINLSLRPDEIDLLRECMKRTEDYYRGLLLLKQDWNAEKNEAFDKVRCTGLPEKPYAIIQNECNGKNVKKIVPSERRNKFYGILPDRIKKINHIFTNQYLKDRDPKNAQFCAPASFLRIIKVYPPLLIQT